jgi:hypothetical protein
LKRESGEVVAQTMRSCPASPNRFTPTPIQYPENPKQTLPNCPFEIKQTAAENIT